MTVNEAARWLSERNDFLILTHTRPDGDTLGSAGALCSALRRAGKRAFLYPNPEVTEKFVPFVKPFFAEKGYTPVHVLSVDTASPNLFPVGFEGKVELAVDHHPSNSGFAENTVLDAGFSRPSPAASPRPRPTFSTSPSAPTPGASSTPTSTKAPFWPPRGFPKRGRTPPACPAFFSAPSPGPIWPWRGPSTPACAPSTTARSSPPSSPLT